MKRVRVLSGIGVVTMLALAAPITRATQGAKERKVSASQLPAAVKEAIKSDCPSCIIAKATREVENGVTVYDVEFKTGQGEMDVAEDGSVIDRETVEQTKDIPAAALEAIRKGAAGGKIKQIAKDEIRAELKDGKVVRLDTPKYRYEADLVKGNQVAEIQVSPEG
ncbi:MAG TPA: PepSY-like domain-containing protein, partial [Blastocatellia bacterium]|nr:PepSY-like domain-containing protein [Blastocatellia bacterium]